MLSSPDLLPALHCNDIFQTSSQHTEDALQIYRLLCFFYFFFPPGFHHCCLKKGGGGALPVRCSASFEEIHLSNRYPCAAVALHPSLPFFLSPAGLCMGAMLAAIGHASAADVAAVTSALRSAPSSMQPADDMVPSAEQLVCGCCDLHLPDQPDRRALCQQDCNRRRCLHLHI